MTDIYFDINKRDVVIENGDFALIDNIAVQSGSILKEARVFDPLNPVFGIGLPDTINAPLSKMNYEMARWAEQAKKDGASKASFKITNSNEVTNIEILVDYE